MNVIRRYGRASLPRKAKPHTAGRNVVDAGMLGMVMCVTEGDLAVEFSRFDLRSRPGPTTGEGTAAKGDTEVAERRGVRATHSSAANCQPMDK